MTPRFAALFWRQSVRSALHRPWLSCLNVSSIALGVAFSPFNWLTREPWKVFVPPLP